MRLDASARTDLGRVRKNNEDAFRIEPDLDLYVLSDGMGGQAHGEVASAMAIETVVAHCREANSDHATTLFGDGRPDLCERSNRLMSAVRLANRRIFDSALQNPAREGMGATVVAAWLDDRRMSLAHVGDSRAYLLLGGRLQRLTRDHTFVERLHELGQLSTAELSDHPQRNVLYRAVGQGDGLEVDVTRHAVPPGARLLLCCDGLWGVVADETLAAVLSEAPTPQAACERLVAAALEAGGPDNISAVLVEIAGP